MADIDKSLPNEVRKTIEIEGPEKEVEITEEIQESIPSQGDTEITPTDDGGVEVNFEPGAFSQPQGEGHFDNLAELLPEEILGPLGSTLNQNYMDYKTSRKEWEHSYIQGLDLLGFKYEQRTEPFQGAAGATHPVLAEAVTQFQALAYKELLPADGPVRTQIIGAPNPQKEQQSQRVKEFMNYQLMDQMKEYEPEFDQMLFYLPLSGSAFKKVYYDDLLQRAVSKFVPAEDLVVPYSATSLEDAESIIHVIKKSENDLRKQQVSGFYRDVELGRPTDNESALEKKERELEGVKKTVNEDVFTLLECHVNLDLEGFEDRTADVEPTGIKLPYIVTLEESSRQILAIRRNYAVDDPKKEKITYFVHFRFLPGLGFYGFGLIHMIGGLSRTATSALRSLLDAGTLSNLPAGFKMRGIRMRDDAQAIQPGEFRDVDAPGGNIKDAFMALPFKEPSQTLLQLMGVVVSAGQRFASIADMQVGDGNQQAAVGTTVALLERGSRTMSAIHKRIYVSLKQEFKLLARVFKLYLPNEYPYDVVGGQRMIKQQDFDDRVDVLPVSDPNIFSMSQRIMLAQTQLQLAQGAPDVHNLYEAYRRMYMALGVQDIESILPPPMGPQPMDPGVENAQSLMMGQLTVFPDQDHIAHIEAHRAFMSSYLVRNNPQVATILQAHVVEHTSAMARQEVMTENGPALQAEIQKFGGEVPPELQAQFQAQLEKLVAVKVAAMTNEMVAEEQEVIPFGQEQDPLVALKQQELDQEQQKINLDAADDLSKRTLEEEKLSYKKQSDAARLAQQQRIQNQRTAVQRERIDASKKR